jgi:hypothetical protein
MGKDCKTQAIRLWLRDFMGTKRQNRHTLSPRRRPRFVFERHGRRTEDPWPAEILAILRPRSSGVKQNGERRSRGAKMCAHQGRGRIEATGFGGGRQLCS